MKLSLLWGSGLVLLAAAVPLAAQNRPGPQDLSAFYGKTIKGAVKTVGFSDRTLDGLLQVSGVFTAEIEASLRGRLTGPRFEHIANHRLIAEEVPGDPTSITLTIDVTEYKRVQTVRFRGTYEFEPDDLKGALRIHAGSTLNPYQLKLDQEYLKSQYQEKGYHFATVRHETEELGGGLVRLTWQIVEGPEVEVDEILFSGNVSIDTDELLDIMSTRESGLFSSPPFIERKLLLDLERIKLYYWLEGWQDIYDTSDGERVILEGLDFSEDRAEVDVRIHIREPERYAVKSVSLEGNTIFTRERIMEWVPLEAGAPASERQVGEYLKVLQGRYHEQGYIMARIIHEWVQESPEDAGKLALRLRVEEGRKMRIGRIDVSSNSRTKDEVVRRELRDFAPGEYYNEDKLERGINRLYDAQYFTYGTIKFWHEEPAAGGDPLTRDVKIEVKEGNTGSIRLLGGYSSSFGFLGVFELTQRNFDITDTPDTFGELLSGDAFVGAGQIFRFRVMPAQRRQSYSAEFREPYIFGEPIGGTIRAYDITTQRRSWDEETLGGNFTLDKRWDNLVVELGFTGFQIHIDNVERDAPRIVRREAGTKFLTSVTPGIRYDTRDSISIPTEGFLGESMVEVAAPPGNFDFYKWDGNVEYHLVLHEAEERNRLSRYVLSSRLDLGYGQPYSDGQDIPIFRRFFAGGRGSIRGYEFRGVGPHDGDDPIGGKVLAAGTLEFTMPLFVDFLRFATFYDVGTVANSLSEVGGPGGEFRHSTGVGFRVIIPFLGNTPVALDFGFPLNEIDGDDEQLITFDVGRLF